MAVLVRRRLHEAHRGEIPGFRGSPEVRQVVLVVGLIRRPDGGDRRRRKVVRIGRGEVILERLMVRDVVALRFAVAADVHGAADRLPARASTRRREPSLEPSPRHAAIVQQVSNVAPGHRHVVARGAVVIGRLWVPDHAPRDRLAGDGRKGAIDLPGDQIERPGRRRPEGRVERVVAHREVLGVVPERRHRVAVEVAHDLALVAPRCAVAGELDELVHQPVVEGQLLLGVVVPLVAGRGLRAAEAERIHRVRILRHEAGAESVHRRRPAQRMEGRLAGGIHGLGVGREIVIERHVLLENDDEMADRPASGPVVLLVRLDACERQCGDGADAHGECN